jgi:hypothetical protein
MSLSIKEIASANLVNIPGWRSKQRILVIESDDWGSIRMASKEAYNWFLQRGVPVDKSAYDSNDSLESNEDLELLFEVLNSVKDRNGNPAVITANNIVANPDFDKIKAAGYQQYFYQPFTETLKEYPHHNRVFDLYKQGIDNRLFRPQFHGREHLNVQSWLQRLQSGDKVLQMAFDKRMFSVKMQADSNCRKQQLDAFGTYTPQQLAALEPIIKEGTALFSSLWGYTSTTIISPCYVWHPEAEVFFAKNGIEMIQSGVAQLAPQFGQEKNVVKRRFTGQKNNLGQYYSVRNATFEPASNPAKDWVSNCLQQIKIAYRWNKPAIVCSHRLNYTGSLNPSNRSANLQLLALLLKEVKKNWPDVIFMSSDQLAVLIKNKNTSI